MQEPELITILEGPTPDFRPGGPELFQSVLEGPINVVIQVCEMRTGNGESIRDRCRQAWRDGRSVMLDFPDDMRLRRQVEVVAMRLVAVDEGTLLMLWVRWPVDELETLDEEAFDEGDFDDDEEDLDP